jgi:glutamine synthetase
MVRIPIGNEKSARVEVRTVAPDVNPYLCIYSILHAGLKGMEEKVGGEEVDKLPGEIYTALEHFEKSEFIGEIMGERSQKKYAMLKRMSAERCPKALGSKIKTCEVIYHHEVTNQMIWFDF